jgi:hypothetical protein
LARGPDAVDASLAGVTVALVDIAVEAAYKRAFVAAKLTLGSGAGARRGGGAGLFQYFNNKPTIFME